ncbi:uncharacterized protein LOC129594050 [Paramacrobiotus metropolitanus]|uniref:uncharacterized protein LOC129594050 n=1 Tax=Paramacrobiotus metropolitanus TaxID=2943436 RepID=UPI00244560B6|nr:uncharacterized protein LOC129594050 [Paramacrobiotus metropolitanus]
MLLLLVFTAIAVAVLGPLPVTAANRNCTAKNARGVAACAFPLLQWSVPSANYEDVTDAQLTAFCQVVRDVVTCQKEVSRPCTEGAMAVLHEAMTPAEALLGACDSSDFGKNVRTLLRCVRKLNQTEETKALACAHKAANQALTNMPKGSNGDNDIIKSFCCNAKAYIACSGSEMADHCDQEAQQVFGMVRDALFDVYKCNGPRGADCPAWPPGLPSGGLKWDLMSLMHREETKSVSANIVLTDEQ